MLFLLPMEHKICFTGPFLYCVCGRIKLYAIDCRLARFWLPLTKMLYFAMQVLFLAPPPLPRINQVGLISSSLSLPCQYYWDHGLLFRQWQHFSVQDCLVVTWNSQKRREELPSRRESTVFSNWTYIIYTNHHPLPFCSKSCLLRLDYSLTTGLNPLHSK